MAVTELPRDMTILGIDDLKVDLCRNCAGELRRYMHQDGTKSWVHKAGLMVSCRGGDGQYLFPVKVAEPMLWKLAMWIYDETRKDQR